jgi:multidrug efflux pump subunit AcrA (membrane-fusion protein)
MKNKLGQHLTYGFLAATVVSTALTVGCASKAQGPPPGGGQGMPVKVLEAKPVAVSDATEYVATLKSRDSAVIMPQVEGQITQINVHSGDRVAAGAALMEIDPLKQQATVKSQEGARAAQEASLALAKQQYQRAQGLAEAGVVSKQD